MHRIGGLEKQDITGNVSYDPENHQHMVQLRAAEGGQHRQGHSAADRSTGPKTGELLVLSWGGTYGACTTAVRGRAVEGQVVAHAHLRYLNPFPANLGEILKRYKKVLIPELNMGQLAAADSQASSWSMRSACNKVKASRSPSPKLSHKIREVRRVVM